MPEKDEVTEWVIEAYVANLGWLISRLNSRTSAGGVGAARPTGAALRTGEAHTLDWCMTQWKTFKLRLTFGTAPWPPGTGAVGDPGLFTAPYRYRLRNVRTEDIIMCAIL
jgi:hypothetical protein